MKNKPVKTKVKTAQKKRTRPLVLNVQSTGFSMPYNIYIEPTFKTVQQDLRAELRYFFKKKVKTKDDLKALITQFKRAKSNLKTLVKKHKK